MSFLPTDSSVVAWWHADDLALADGTSVTTWTDKSSNALPATGSTAKPIYKTAQANGKGTVRFNGASTFLTVGTPSALVTPIDTGTYSLLLVHKPNSAGFNAIIAATAGSNLLIVPGGSFGGIAFDYTPYIASAHMVILGLTGQGSYAGSSSGKLSRIYFQGACVYGDTTNSLKTTGGNAICLGNNAGQNFPYDGDIFDVVVVNRELTPLEMWQLSKYFMDQYAMTYPWTGQNCFDIYWGDSLTAGVGAGGEASYPSVVAQTNSRPIGSWFNLGVGGIDLGNMRTHAVAEVYPLFAGLPLYSILFLDEWYNSDKTDPTVFAATAVEAAGYGAGTGLKIIAVTPTNASSGETDRQAWITYLKANYLAFDAVAVADPGTATHIGASGTDYTNSTYYSDIVHLTAAGYAIKGAVVAAVESTFNTPGIVTMTFTGTLTGSSTIRKQGNKSLSSSASSSGTAKKQGAKPKSGTITSTGNPVKLGKRVLSGSQARSGSVVKKGMKLLSGVSSLVYARSSPQTSTFTNTGTFILPTGGIVSKVVCLGVGGNGSSPGQGGGGGGGGYAELTTSAASITPGSYAVSVGGGSSSFSISCVAVDGESSSSQTGGEGGGGGGSSNVGDLTNIGGKGGDGDQGGGAGGAPGSASGMGSDGGNGDGAGNGGIAPSGAGNGGTVGGSDAQSATSPGYGGGGCAVDGGSPGSGFAGHVVVTYTVPVEFFRQANRSLVGSIPTSGLIKKLGKKVLSSTITQLGAIVKFGKKVFLSSLASTTSFLKVAISSGGSTLVSWYYKLLFRE